MEGGLSAVMSVITGGGGGRRFTGGGTCGAAAKATMPHIATNPKQKRALLCVTGNILPAIARDAFLRPSIRIGPFGAATDPTPKI